MRNFPLSQVALGLFGSLLFGFPISFDAEALKTFEVVQYVPNLALYAIVLSALVLLAVILGSKASGQLKLRRVLGIFVVLVVYGVLIASFFLWTGNQLLTVTIRQPTSQTLTNLSYDYNIHYRSIVIIGLASALGAITVGELPKYATSSLKDRIEEIRKNYETNMRELHNSLLKDFREKNQSFTKELDQTKEVYEKMLREIQAKYGVLHEPQKKEERA